MNSIVDWEISRYTERKAVYNLISISMLVGFCVGIPLLAEIYWPLLIKYMNDNNISKEQLYLWFTMS